MFRHHLNQTTSWKTHFDWFLLSFIAGCVNAGGFLGAYRFVSHITGFATLFGIEGAKGSWDQAVGILSIPLFFLLGVMISAYLIIRPLQRGQRPHYALVMALVSLCLFMVSAGGYFQLFGPFGSEPRLSRDYLFLALLCTASGLQNAAISTASGATIRTTHLTGVLTDLGTSLVKAHTNHKSYATEMKAARLRLGTIVSFTSGSFLSSYFFLKIHYLGFLIPAGLAAYAVYAASASKRRLSNIRRIRLSKLS